MLLLWMVALLTIFYFAFWRKRSEQRAETINEARMLIEDGEPELARQILEPLARQRARAARGRMPALYWLGHALEQLGRPNHARQVYERFLSDYGHPRALPRAPQKLIDRVEERLGAMRALTGSLESTADTLPNELDVAQDLLKQGGREGAREAQLRVRNWLSTATAESPGWDVALETLGRSHQALDEPERALEVYRSFLAGATPVSVSQRLIHTAVRARVERLEESLGQARETPWQRFKHTQEPPPLPSEQAPTVELPARSEEDLARDARYLARGLRVGEYVLAEKVGDGGFGEVFRALRPVAIKFARSPDQVEQLRRFGALQASVDSERIVKPLEVNLEATPPYVVMEYVDGATLRDLLSSHGPPEPGAGLALMTEVARALRDAHAARLLHLDLKPANVLLDASGRVKLTDFELGRLQGEASQLRLSLSFRSEEEHGVAGTLAYMSPEQRAGKVPDARSDVFTFGVLLFETLTGTLPEPGDRPSDFVPNLPEAVDKVFERCFSRYERRYADAAELCADVERACAERVGPAELARLFARVERRAHDAEVLLQALSARLERLRARARAAGGRGAPARATRPRDARRRGVPRRGAPRRGAPARAPRRRATRPRDARRRGAPGPPRAGDPGHPAGADPRGGAPRPRGLGRARAPGRAGAGAGRAPAPGAPAGSRAGVAARGGPGPGDSPRSMG
ncbi:MAG: serine/threonine-protein kinase [Planctomycetota bacterium]